jgi:hypothetical protein
MCIELRAVVRLSGEWYSTAVAGGQKKKRQRLAFVWASVVAPRI